MSDHPEIFLAGVVELFENYPGDVVYRAVSPTFGIPAKFKFIPRIAEIKEFLEELMQPVYRQQQRERISAENARPLPAPVNRSRRLSYDELKAKYGEDWGITHERKKPKWQPPSAEELKSMVGADGWNKIPNAK